MKGWTVVRLAGAAFLLILFAGPGAGAMAAEDQPTHVEVELTESFYRALRDEGTKTYGTKMSEEYLRQIAVSTRFMVESNLKIIKGQERIIELLEAIRNKKQ